MLPLFALMYSSISCSRFSACSLVSSGVKKIVFNFPVPVDGEEVKELPLETETTVESVVTLSKREAAVQDAFGNPNMI